ncbi:MAG: hypothetical protein QF731_10415 [Verrucomicrobiota bacterium]|jgi:hypothetical protein|nr:hypothetical protein [Verrucomicrobiota bacterium]
MAKPSLKTILLATTCFIAAGILVNKAIIPWMINDVKKLELATANRKKQINTLTSLKRNSDLSQKRLAKFRSLGFAKTKKEATAKMGELLTNIIKQSGLNETEFSRRPYDLKPIVGFSGNHVITIAHIVSGTGSTKKIIDLLFLLQNDPHIQRVENISLSPISGTTNVRVNFQFISLLINSKYGDYKGTNSPPINPSIKSEARDLYAGITKRALFLPYQKKPPAPPTPSKKPKTNRTPPPPGPESYKVVSLSQWKGKQEVMIYNTAKNETKSYKLGDSLAGGTIVMIDYRQMPFPKKPELLSQSRVIVSIKTDYWAIERGNTMADIYKLTPEQLPEKLIEKQL